jgi:hypothetical protein
MKAGMVAAYRDKSGRDDVQIETLMAAETWLSAEEAVDLGLANRVEQPVRMAAHFDLSRFRNTPPQLAAILTSSTPQEDEMSDPQKTRARKPDPDPPATAQAPAHGASSDDGDADAITASHAVETAQPKHAPAPATALQPAPAVLPVDPSPPATAQVIDLDAVRADERKATLAYVSEVHELCALAGRGDLAASFVTKATPVAQVRRALLEARAAEDEATAIRSQVRPASVEPVQPAIDTAAIYAARNQNVC